MLVRILITPLRGCFARGLLGQGLGGNNKRLAVDGIAVLVGRNSSTSSNSSNGGT